MGVILYILSRILSTICKPIGIITAFIVFTLECRSFGEFFKRVNDYFFEMAKSEDQSGNTSMQFLFNLLFIKKDGYKFGNIDEFISSVLGKNLRMGTLTTLGKGLNWVLNLIDKNHSIDSIEEDEGVISQK